jgi:glycerophosphoryl diester phosphodiesterase
MGDGVGIVRAGHPIRLKWHRLRRVRADTPFTTARLAEGLKLGASMEVDLRILADGRFAVLHNKTLDRETTGSGPVNAASTDDLRKLRLRSSDGAPTRDPVLLLDDLAALVPRDSASDALVQLDLKEPRDTLSEAAAESFAAAVAPVARNMIISGGHWDAVKYLATTAGDLRVGFDPCELPEAGGLRTPADVAAFVAASEAIAPDAAMIYLDYTLILKALDLGYDIVDAFHVLGKEIDAWTLNPDHPNAANSLGRLIECRVDQITSDEPIAIEELAGAAQLT